MPKYTTTQAVRTHSGVGDSVSNERIDEIILEAENEIDSTIMMRYTLPLSEVPELIRQTAKMLAAGRLEHEEFGDDGYGDEKINQAQETLTKLKEGRLRLLNSKGSELSIRQSATMVTGNVSDPIFEIDTRY